MEQEIKQKLEEQDAKLNAIYSSVEKTRKYFLVVMWVTVIAVVFPIIGLFVAIPKFINTYSTFNGLL